MQAEVESERTPPALSLAWQINLLQILYFLLQMVINGNIR